MIKLEVKDIKDSCEYGIFFEIPYNFELKYIYDKKKDIVHFLHPLYNEELLTSPLDAKKGWGYKNKIENEAYIFFLEKISQCDISNFRTGFFETISYDEIQIKEGKE